MNTERMGEVSSSISTVADWVKLLAGLVMVFTLFQGLAQMLGSDRGQAGVVVAGVVVAALIAIETMLFGRSPAAAFGAIGLRRPTFRGILAALIVGAVLLTTLPLYALERGTQLTIATGWIWMLPGLFAQAGIAEEALFRGYLYGHLRNARTFWKAAALSTLPFMIVHLYLFATMDWPVALAALLLSALISFPLAHLYEIGGRTIWAPALVHFVVQAALKVVTIADDRALPLVWMVACALIPFAAFLVTFSTARKFRNR